MPKSSRHYVNNNDLLKAMIEYKKELKLSKKHNKEAPEINEYIGMCFLKIAEHLSRKPNFMSYTFREDMISDAVENCIQYAANFNPTKSKNPFAYFTRITFCAFLRRIDREKKQLYIKYKATEQLGLLQSVEMHDLEGLGPGAGKNFQVYENITDFIQAFEQSRRQKKCKKNNTLKAKVTASRNTLKFIGD